MPRFSSTNRAAQARKEFARAARKKAGPEEASNLRLLPSAQTALENAQAGWKGLSGGRKTKKKKQKCHRR